MKLKAPFEISPRLAPALRIANSHYTAWLSFDDGDWIIDLPDGTEHIVEDFNPPPSQDYNLQDCFRAILNFLDACAESRASAVSEGCDPMDGENSDLFPPEVGVWAEMMSDEIARLAVEIEESEGELISDHQI